MSQPNVVDVLGHVATVNGTLYTEWGPCVGDGGDDCGCITCRHAADLEARGLDWEEEYQKWLASGAPGRTVAASVAEGIRAGVSKS